MIYFLFSFGLIGILWSISRRIRLYPYEPFWGIVNNDYYFSEYATIPLLSFLYTLYQGIAYGLSAGFLSFKFVVGIARIQQNYSWCDKIGLVRCETGNEYFFYAFIWFISVILVRISIEAYMLAYKVGQVFIDRFEGSCDREEWDEFDNNLNDL